jgi:hypothetical protein
MAVYGSRGNRYGSDDTVSITYVTDVTQIVINDDGDVGMGNGKGRIKFEDETIDVISVRTAYLRLQLQEDDFAIVNGTLLGRLDYYGDDDTASADEVAGQIDVTATSTWTDGDEDSRMELSVLNNGTLNNDQLVLATDGSVTTSGLFTPTDLEIPQASPAVPGVDGGVEVDFTDGTLVVQHGSAHAELGSATDVVMGKLIKSFSATLGFPDDLQAEIDNWPLKNIESSEFPHGIVVTRVYLKTSASSTYSLNIENWDDPDSIKASDSTIVAVATSASLEADETSITNPVVAAGQIIMLDLDTDDLGWIEVTVEYYEPAA